MASFEPFVTMAPPDLRSPVPGLVRRLVLCLIGDVPFTMPARLSARRLRPEAVSDRLGALGR